MRTPRERQILAATAALAVGVPVGAAAWLRSATDGLAAQLTEAGGVPARIGGVDADLTGAVRISDVALGGLVSAEAIEASVGMGSLLGGRLRADEVRVERPRVAVQIDAAGGSDLARLARRLAQRSGGRAPGGSGDAGAGGSVRRILVSRGALTAVIEGVGELSAEGVELLPDASGVRVITGPVRLTARWDRPGAPAALELSFSRAAAELALPAVHFGRVLAVGGAGTATAGTEAVALRDVAAGRLGPGAPLELHAAVADGAAQRPLSLELSREPSHEPSRDPAHAPGAGLSLTVRGEAVPLRALAPLLPAGLDLSGARATGAVTVRRRPGALEVTADAALDRLVVAHPAVTAQPTPLDVHVRGSASISRDAIAWTDGALALGAARLSTNGWIRRGAGPLSGQLEVQLAAAPCAELLTALPPELRGPLDGMALGGTLGARARLAIDLAAPLGEGASIESELSGACTTTIEPPAADVTLLARPGEQQLLDGTRRRVGRGEPGHVPLRSLPEHVPGAFVAAEDARFFEHAGFDLEQIARSLEIDLRERRLARGGSTISQQLVKNAFLSQRRSFDRKLHEAVLAWRLEARLGKREILERYLNVIELGPRLFGLGAAAHHWFGVPAQDLAIRQAAFLAALTSQPQAMSRRVRRAGGLDAESAERVSVILRGMRARGTISAAELADAKSEPLGFERSALREP